MLKFLGLSLPISLGTTQMVESKTNNTSEITPEVTNLQKNIILSILNGVANGLMNQSTLRGAY